MIRSLALALIAGLGIAMFVEAMNDENNARACEERGGQYVVIEHSTKSPGGMRFETQCQILPSMTDHR